PRKAAKNAKTTQELFAVLATLRENLLVIEIIQAQTPDHMDEARKIFTEYENWLGVSLCFQGFDDEMAGLPGKYAPPEGRLLFAMNNGVVAGCVASRPIDEETCEMKRLFVREGSQG